MVTRTKEKKIAYLIRVKAKSQVTIPAPIYKRLHLKRGVFLEATTDGRKIVLEPKTICDQHEDDIDKAFRESIGDLKAGRVFGPFSSVDEMRKALRDDHS